MEKDTVASLQDSQSTYGIFVPDSYDASHNTPIELFVWMHACGGEGSGDIYTISPGGSQSYIAISIGGREDDCSDPNTDQDKVLADNTSPFRDTGSAAADSIAAATNKFHVVHLAHTEDETYPLVGLKLRRRRPPCPPSAPRSCRPDRWAAAGSPRASSGSDRYRPQSLHLASGIVRPLVRD